MAEAEQSLSQEQSEKLKLVIAKVVPYCTPDAERDEFRMIAAGIEKGDELTGEILEGSTNFSYRVHLKGDKNVSLFVKVAFDFARWNPDRSAHYSLDRITSEHDMLKRFAKPLGGVSPVAEPYFCDDIAPGIRMLVVQWAHSNHPWASQFVEGTVDSRIVRGVAEFIARVNLEDYGDKDLNDGIKNSFRALYPICKGAFGQMISGDGEPSDHFVAFARKMGQERFDSIIDAMGESYERCDTLLHGDTHALNILVEPHADDGTFGELGEFYVADWEMVHAGAKGRDPGTFYAWPILSAYFLAARGEKRKAYNVLHAMYEFWEVYAAKTVEMGQKDDIFLLEVYRSSLAWCGVYAFIANFLLRAQYNYIPFDLVSTESGAKAFASVGLTGLQCLEYGFLNVDPELSLDQLRQWFKTLVEGQVEFLLEVCSSS